MYKSKQCFVAFAAMGTLTMSAPAVAVALTGVGGQIPLDTTVAKMLPAYVNPTYPLSGPPFFTGSWTLPAAPAWMTTSIGGSGNSDTSSQTNGITTYNFAPVGGLPGSSPGLPVDTYFIFSDIDAGSGPNELLTLRAFNTLLQPITTPWLEIPSAYFGESASAPMACMMPGVSFTPATGTYTFDGSKENCGVNPTLGFLSTNNTQISRLEVDKPNINYGFGLAAPVPEPSTLLLLGFGISGLIVYNQRRKKQDMST